MWPKHRLILAFVLPLLLGCQSNLDSTPVVIDGQSDTLVVLASRLWSSNTYQDFLSPIISSHQKTVEWIDASDIDAIQLVASLGRADGVLLTGGADIHPARYRQPQDTVVCGTIEPIRDSLESYLLNWLDQSHVPCLGICRGMQFMNVHGGGSLHPHLPELLGTNAHRAGDEKSHRDTTHVVMAIKSIPGIEAGEQGMVISHHHQGIEMVATTLEVWARSPDGLAEGIRRKDTLSYPCYLGVQWHPERSKKNQPFVESLGEFFVHSMVEYSTTK